MPVKTMDSFVRRNFHKRFVYKYIDGMQTVFGCMFLQVIRDFRPDFRRNKVKDAAAENNVIAFGYPEIGDIRFKKVYTGITFFGKFFPLLDSCF